MHHLRSHTWPGNVRELENAMSRAVALAAGAELTVEDLGLGPAPRTASGQAAYAATLNLEELEKIAILRALAETDWNKIRAADKLGIFASSLYKKMRRFGIPKSPPQ